MRSSLSAIALALLAGGIQVDSAWAQNVYGPVGYGGATASVSPTPDYHYYNANYAPSELPTTPPSPPPSSSYPPGSVYQPGPTYPQTNQPAPSYQPYRAVGAENVPTPAPGPNGQNIYGDIGRGDAYTGWGGMNGCNNCLDGVCGNPCPRWSVYANGLWMGRNMPNHAWTTYEIDNNPNQLMYFPGSDWGGGFETGLTYWFGCPNECGGCGRLNPYCNCCYQNGIQVVYWGIWGLDGNASLYSDNNQLGTPYNLGFVIFDNDPDLQAADFFDNARSHRLSRTNEIHNVEINLLHIPCCTGVENLKLTWLAGVRYFRFSEDLQFGALAGTSPDGAQFGQDPADEAYLDVNVENNLVGFQLGARGDYCIHDRWTIFAVPKAGIFGNYVTNQNVLYRGNGQLGTFEETGNPFDIDSSATVFSFLASIDVGFTYAFTENWLFTAGYRVVCASQVALGDNQLPFYWAGEEDWRDIDTNGDLILHGGFAGLEFRF